MSYLRGNNGQGLVEYIVLLVLMAIVLVASVRYLATKTDKKFRETANTIAGL